MRSPMIFSQRKSETEGYLYEKSNARLRYKTGGHKNVSACE